ncbi:MAG: hypothetical protein COY40_05815 [Alphaproteobacteria bacterium CG_4_10_14_0_8_um_filter_53_9]|nr:MAG: hypothetical protein COY40_05815 [Alphaproteobacteria bacterium CG_4_10_14_0_8_um_filter_53_9]
MFSPDSPHVNEVRESPNFRLRGEDGDVCVVVIHGTWMADDEAAMARLCDPATEVSCHYYIDREGKIFQLVEERHVAWHAGKSVWRGQDVVNGFSLGIEIGNAGNGLGEKAPPVEAIEPYKPVQYEALVRLLTDICARYEGVEIVGHSDIAPVRKADPGDHFDWDFLRAAGLPVAPEV